MATSSSICIIIIFTISREETKAKFEVILKMIFHYFSFLAVASGL